MVVMVSMLKRFMVDCSRMGISCSTVFCGAFDAAMSGNKLKQYDCRFLFRSLRDFDACCGARAVRVPAFVGWRCSRFCDVAIAGCSGRRRLFCGRGASLI